MQFFTIISALAATVLALPSESMPKGGEPSGGSTNVCGNGNVESCCNTKNQGNNQLLPISAVLCEIPIIVDLAAPCNGNPAFCCPTDENGLINVGSICVPIGV